MTRTSNTALFVGFLLSSVVMLQNLKFHITVDWEGTSLRPENLKRLQRFSQQWRLPLVHYMNPAYFTHEQFSEQQDILRKLPDIFPEDEFGLHLHAPEHLLRAAGVPQRQGPCFSRNGDAHTNEWHGQEVMLLAYEEEEFARLLEFSIEQFQEKGLGRPRAFRAGGWMMHPDFYSVLARFGFVSDSSMVPSDVVVGSCWENENIHRYLELLYPKITKSSQPFKMEEGIEQWPNNFGAIDYWSQPNSIIKDLQSLPQGATVVITCHQETAVEHLDKLDQVLTGFLLQNSSSFFTAPSIGN